MTGRPLRMLTLIDEFTRECLAIDVARRMDSEDVLERLSDLFVRRGVPKYLRSDNGAEFTAHKVTRWLEQVGVQTLFIEPGSPWENGFIESFNGKLRDELLNGEIFETLLEAKVLIERWRAEYNTVRPHSALGSCPRPGIAAAGTHDTSHSFHDGTCSSAKLQTLCAGFQTRGLEVRNCHGINGFFDHLKACEFSVGVVSLKNVLGHRLHLLDT